MDYRFDFLKLSWPSFETFNEVSSEKETIKGYFIIGNKIEIHIFLFIGLKISYVDPVDTSNNVKIDSTNKAFLTLMEEHPSFNF